MPTPRASTRYAAAFTGNSLPVAPLTSAPPLGAESGTAVALGAMTTVLASRPVATAFVKGLF